jgi:hypothetical protein
LTVVSYFSIFCFANSLFLTAWCLLNLFANPQVASINKLNPTRKKALYIPKRALKIPNHRLPAIFQICHTNCWIQVMAQAFSFTEASLVKADTNGLISDNHIDIPNVIIIIDPKDISNHSIQYKNDRNINTIAINNFLLNFSLKETTKKFVTKGSFINANIRAI